MNSKIILCISISLFFGSSCKKSNNACPESVSDIDGNLYHTVSIGSQCWTIENLKTTRYNDGTAMLTDLNDSDWMATTSGAFCIYDNNMTHNATYGKLYNFYAVNTGKLAPEGWHVPSKAEWIILKDFLGGETIAGNKLKANSDLWTSYSGITNTNSSGFSGLPGGYRYDHFYNLGFHAYFWSSTEELSTGVASYLSYDKAFSPNFFNSKNDGLSVRCLKD